LKLFLVCSYKLILSLLLKITKKFKYQLNISIILNRVASEQEQSSSVQRPVTAQPCRAWQQVRGALRNGQVAKIRSRTAKPAVVSAKKPPPRIKTTTSKIKEQGKIKI